jgi:hypothetical protein
MPKHIQLSPRQLYQIKITLRDIKPPIWRRIIVPADYTLSQLHEIIQVTMGWQNMHLYHFRVGKLRFGEPDEEFPDEMLNARAVQLGKIIERLPKNIPYEYDFGDSWEHDLKFEKIIEWKKGMHIPQCTEGARACPPEDCGGVPGYEDILEALKNPNTKENKALLDWLGEYDPEGFDLNDINDQLKDL